VSVLVLAPHMDDEVLGCGGLLQKCRLDPRFPRVLFATKPKRIDVRLNAGGEYRDRERRREAQAASRLLRFEYMTLTYETHTLDRVPQEDLIHAIEEQLRSTELVVVPGESHDQDHQALRKAALAATRPQLFDGTVLEYMTWGVPDPYAPSLVLPLSPNELVTKLDALECYDTQLRDAPPTYPYSPASVMGYAWAAGRLIGRAAGEAFVPRRLVPNASTARLLGGL
jgi:LmbE family N-acetylglucosaminyl deacetylase